MAETQDPHCTKIMDHELDVLHMCEFFHPAAGVKKTEGARNLVTFEAGPGDTHLAIMDFLDEGHKRTAFSTPSIFGGHDDRELVLNSHCEIESISLASQSTGIHLFANDCHKIETIRATAGNANAIEAKIKSSFGHPFWVDNAFLIDLVEKICREYKEKNMLAPETPSRPAAAAAPSKDKSAVKPDAANK